MEAFLKKGIDKMRFGMKRQDVLDLYGPPDREFRDEDKNITWIYNMQRWRLTFYEDEEFRLGYLITAHPELELFGNRIVGREVEEVKAQLKPKGFDKWEEEAIDITTAHFNEDHWVVLQSEFGVVTKFELGAALVNDMFVWAHL